MLSLLKEPEVVLAAWPRKLAFKSHMTFFFCYPWVRKTSLKGTVAHYQKTVRSCAKLCIFVSRIKWTLVDHIGTSICYWDAACLFPHCPDSWNNHTETIWFKPLLGPLALASYWLTLTSYFNPFPLICASPHGCGLLAKVPASVSGGLHGFSLTLPSLS